MSTNKPINDIIRIAERDANLPSTGKANKQIPNFNLRDLGYDDNQFASAEELNYTFDNMGQWLSYFDNRVDELQKQAEDEDNPKKIKSKEIIFGCKSCKIIWNS